MRIPLQIRFGDIDRLGHVNNAVYAQFFDIGRVEYIRKCMPDMGFNDKTLVLVRLETNFVLPIFEKDEIYVNTTVEKVGERSLHMWQEIVDKDGILRSTCKSILSTLDMQTGKSFPMPQLWKELLTVKY